MASPSSPGCAGTVSLLPPQEEVHVVRQGRVTISPAAKLSRSDFQANLALQEFALCFSKENGHDQHTILLEDIVGITVLPGAPDTSKKRQTCRLIVNQYSPDPGKGEGKVPKRCLKVTPIDFDEEETFEGNHRVAQEWKEAILIETNRAVRKSFETTKYSEEDEGIVPRRRLLVLINPVSGQGKGESLFIKCAQPLFEMAEIDFTVTVTNRINHARELVKEFDLSTIDGIVISSGDGLIYEVVNGLLERDDWQTAIKTPIGILPTGSGNVLATNVFHEADEEYDVSVAAFIIVRGGLTRGDLATVELQNGQKMYMSLLSCWGYVADLDIETEWLRSLGETRFVLGAIKSIFQRRVYPGRIYYLPLEDMEKCNEQEHTRKDSELQEVPVAKDNDEGNVEQEGATSNGSSPVKPLSCPPADLLSPLSDPVPAGWKKIEGNFTGTMAMMTPFTAHKARGGSLELGLGCGEIHLTYGLDMSRIAMAHMVLTVESGSYLNREDLFTVKTRAYRIEPLSDTGVFVVDGEVIDYAAHQVQLHPHMLRFMTRKRKLTHPNKEKLVVKT